MPVLQGPPDGRVTPSALAQGTDRGNSEETFDRAFQSGDDQPAPGDGAEEYPAVDAVAAHLDIVGLRPGDCVPGQDHLAFMSAGLAVDVHRCACYPAGQPVIADVEAAAQDGGFVSLIEHRFALIHEGKFDLATIADWRWEMLISFYGAPIRIAAF